MDLTRSLETLRRRLATKGTKDRAQGEKKYLKSTLTHLGVPVPEVRRTAKQWCAEHDELSHDQLLELVRLAWQTDVFELRSVTIAILARRTDLLRASDMAALEALLRIARTWAHIDWLSTAVIGELVARYRTARRRLDRWARDDDFWVRRAAMLALLPGLRTGEGDWEGFVGFAVPMLEDKEFFIRKAIGWVLREVSKKRPALVRAFVDAHGERMSGLTRREATKYLDGR